MKKKIVYGMVLVGIFLPVFFGISETNAEITARGTTGNFVHTNEIISGYFPTTNLLLNLANLTTTENYGVLIGANQNATDYQWVNFTASQENVEIKTVHFKDQSTGGYIDPDSPETFIPNLDQLRINLYGILNDEDSSPTLLDTYWLKIRYFDEQIPDDTVSVMLSVIIIMGALTGIFLTVLKYIRN